MPILLRAILTGFGYKIGAELGRYVVEQVGLKTKKATKDNDVEVPEVVPPEDKDAEAEPEPSEGER